MGSGLSFENLEDFVGQQIALTPWREIPQADATAFGALTGDPDPMHVDPDWARTNSPFGETVLAGFHLLSLLPSLTRGSGLEIAGVGLAMNYGFERIRFVSPVPVGAAFRNRVTLLRVERRADGKVTITTNNAYEFEGEDKPALIAEWVNMLWPETK
jgi:acyl dehydratase